MQSKPVKMNSRTFLTPKNATAPLSMGNAPLLPFHDSIQEKFYELHWSTVFLPTVGPVPACAIAGIAKRTSAISRASIFLAPLRTLHAVSTLNGIKRGCLIFGGFGTRKSEKSIPGPATSQMPAEVPSVRWT